jgi:molybdate transport system substrate-binding protein
MRFLSLIGLFAVTSLSLHPAAAADVKVLTAGAFKQVILALAPAFTQETGNKLSIENDTAGALTKRIESGEAFDLVVLPPNVLAELAAKGRVVAGSARDLARVGIGVVVKQGAPAPDIATLAAFKQSLLDAKSIAYIDPKAGGSSGVYVSKLFERLGIADQVKAKAVLVQGGAVAEHIADGEADIGIHQISEILAVKNISLVGPLPAEIQNYTTYGAAVSASAKEPRTAQAFLDKLTGPEAAAVLKQKGMEPSAAK